MPSSLHKQLQERLSEWSQAGKPETLNTERESSFASLAAWIKEQKTKQNKADLIFVCTHNSRRSHISQLWAQAAAAYFELGHVQTYSGGTEMTAFNPRSVKALRKHGFEIKESGEKLSEKNIVYQTFLGKGYPLIRGFSKKYDHAHNPKRGFAAVMVCSQADKQCPYVDGADLRVSIPYLDPKVSDNTPEEGATYLAKSEEIGREMLWLMSLVSK